MTLFTNIINVVTALLVFMYGFRMTTSALISLTSLYTRSAARKLSKLEGQMKIENFWNIARGLMIAYVAGALLYTIFFK